MNSGRPTRRVTAGRAAAIVLAACCAACQAAGGGAQEFPKVEALRGEMIQTQLRSRGIRSPRVLEAMGRVPRHRFVPDPFQVDAYGDHPLPIGHGQTISQPFIVAYMTELIEPQPSDRVLEVGAGSGYQAAVLAELAGEVYSVEIVPELAERATRTLTELGYTNVHIRQGDGYVGWPEAAPFQKIILTAAPPDVPQALIDQLADGGVLIAPVGPADGIQVMTIVRKTGEGVVTEQTIGVRFVPMVPGDTERR